MKLKLPMTMMDFLLRVREYGFLNVQFIILIMLKMSQGNLI